MVWGCALPDPPVADLRAVGIDDVAVRRRHIYATIVVDLQTRRPIEVLEGREAGPVAAWLTQHPAIEVVCRDRARAYAEAARVGAPQAQQVADRWHPWRNLGEAVDKTVAAHHSCIKTAFTAAEPTTGRPAPAATARPALRRARPAPDAGGPPRRAAQSSSGTRHGRPVATRHQP